jgi:hypothetical protein
MPGLTAPIWAVSSSNPRTRQSIFSSASQKRLMFICLNSFFNHPRVRRRRRPCVRVASRHVHAAKRNSTPRFRRSCLLPKRQTSMSQLPQMATGRVSSFSAKAKAIFLTRIGSGSRFVFAVDFAIEIDDRFAAKGAAISDRDLQRSCEMTKIRRALKTGTNPAIH